MNAKQEFLDFTKNKSVKCALIEYADMWLKEERRDCTLKIGYTEKEMSDFLNSLDFNYDAGYGGQELFGEIWFKDGTWGERGEYDGSEWWRYNSCPEIPDILN